MIREILLVPHTHHDVGYTNSPRVVDRVHREIVGEVLRLADAAAAPGGADQLRWTFEVARPVLAFLRDAAPAERQQLRELVAAGRVSVTGGYLNMTQLTSAAELDAGYDLLHELRVAGMRPRTEQHGDVNGIAWSTVEGMRRAGLSRLVMALNPDHGRAPYPQPTGFWWVGQSGARVFVWLSTHYGVGEEWGIVEGDVESAIGHIDFVKHLEARSDYPYEVAVVHAANDNRWPTLRMLDVVRGWNAAHPELPMRTATIDDALDVLERQAERADIPVARGEWSDWWSHGHGSTAREVAVYREARTFARAAQTSLALALLRGDGEPPRADVIGYRRGPVRLRSEAELVADLAHVDEQLLLFGEHTWGSWETYRKPHSTFSHSHWNAKAGFAYTAYDVARDLAIEGMFRLAASGPAGAAAEPGAIMAVNPTERTRREPVDVEVDGQRRARTVMEVPAFGVGRAPVPARMTRRTGAVLAIGRYRAVVDPARGGVVSLIDTRTGRELVDATVEHGLAATVVEQVATGSTHPMLTDDPRYFRPDHPGPQFVRQPAVGDTAAELQESAELGSITWQGSGPGVPQVRSTLTLYADIDVIDVDVELVKPERMAPESIFVAFPFEVRDPRFLVETAGAVYTADSEQLPDTSKDWYSIQHAVGVTNDEHGIVWGSFDAPLVQLGGFHTGTWARRLAVTGGQVNSWLMNNLHFTNFQARQDGTRRYRYRFRPAPTAVDPTAVRVFGRDLLEPLQARQYTGPSFAGGSGLRVEPAERVFAEVRPLGGGAIRVRVRNIGPQPVAVSLTWDGNDRSRRADTSLDGYGVADIVLRVA
ncbi:MAG TPA: hypothetical protein VE442_20670 [Jatrophihabitans sp.]|nr:hypothetical protein [Jatrophihabitans sp.]